MKYSFEILVTVSFSHTYFSNGTFGGFAVEPSEQTLKTFLNNGMLFKPFNGGFRILYDTGFAGGERGRNDVLSNTADCCFALRLTDTGFYNYTELDATDITKSIFSFRNTKENGSILRTSLHEEEYAGAKDLYPLNAVSEKYFTKPFAQIDLRLAGGLEERYSITFRSKETYWRYILVGEALQSLNSPAIIDSAGSAFFDGPEILPVHGKEALVFRSKSPISFNQSIPNVFQLVDNYDAESGRYKVVMRALPSANPNYITQFGPDRNTLNYSEIFIH